MSRSDEPGDEDDWSFDGPLVSNSRPNYRPIFEQFGVEHGDWKSLARQLLFAHHPELHYLFGEPPPKSPGRTTRWTTVRLATVQAAVDRVMNDPKSPPARRNAKGAVEYLLRYSEEFVGIFDGSPPKAKTILNHLSRNPGKSGTA